MTVSSAHVAPAEDGREGGRQVRVPRVHGGVQARAEGHGAAVRAPLLRAVHPALAGRPHHLPGLPLGIPRAADAAHQVLRAHHAPG